MNKDTDLLRKSRNHWRNFALILLLVIFPVIVGFSYGVHSQNVMVEKNLKEYKRQAEELQIAQVTLNQEKYNLQVEKQKLLQDQKNLQLHRDVLQHDLNEQQKKMNEFTVENTKAKEGKLGEVISTVSEAVKSFTSRFM